MGYIRILPTLFVVITTFAALFITVVSLLRVQFGRKVIWPFWAFYLFALSVSCVYKLSGLRYEVAASTIGRAVYLFCVAIVAVGVPLGLGASILARKDEPRSLHTGIRSAAVAWMACVAATPAAAALVAVVDFANLIITSS